MRGDAVTSHRYGSPLFASHFQLSSLEIYFQFLENTKFDNHVVKCVYFTHDCMILDRFVRIEHGDTAVWYTKISQ